MLRLQFSLANLQGARFTFFQLAALSLFFSSTGTSIAKYERALLLLLQVPLCVTSLYYPSHFLLFFFLSPHACSSKKTRRRCQSRLCNFSLCNLHKTQPLLSLFYTLWCNKRMGHHQHNPHSHNCPFALFFSPLTSLTFLFFFFLIFSCTRSSVCLLFMATFFISFFFSQHKLHPPGHCQLYLNVNLCLFPYKWLLFLGELEATFSSSMFFKLSRMHVNIIHHSRMRDKYKFTYQSIVNWSWAGVRTNIWRQKWWNCWEERKRRGSSRRRRRRRERVCNGMGIECIQLIRLTLDHLCWPIDLAWATRQRGNVRRAISCISRSGVKEKQTECFHGSRRLMYKWMVRCLSQNETSHFLGHWPIDTTPSYCTWLIDFALLCRSEKRKRDRRWHHEKWHEVQMQVTWV